MQLLDIWRNKSKFSYLWPNQIKSWCVYYNYNHFETNHTDRGINVQRAYHTVSPLSLLKVPKHHWLHLALVEHNTSSQLDLLAALSVLSWLLVLLLHGRLPEAWQSWMLSWQLHYNHSLSFCIQHHFNSGLWQKWETCRKVHTTDSQHVYSQDYIAVLCYSKGSNVSKTYKWRELIGFHRSLNIYINWGNASN